MKKLSFFFAFLAFTLTSCSSDEPGPQGPPGINILGQTFGDLTSRNFQYDEEFNLYNHFLEIPGTIEVLESDAVLVYRLEVIDNVETWNLIPKSYFLNEGRIIQYSFNHTHTDVEILITGNFDLSSLENFYTQNQYFKFVVVPSDFISETGVDVSNYDEVMQALEL